MHKSEPSHILVTNPFDGSEVGSTVDMPPQAALALLLTSSESGE